MACFGKNFTFHKQYSQTENDSECLISWLLPIGKDASQQEIKKSNFRKNIRNCLLKLFVSIYWSSSRR